MSKKEDQKPKGTSRREFLAITGAGVAGLVVGGVVGRQAFPQSVQLPPQTVTATTTLAAPKLALVWTESNCTGCEACIYACSQYHEGAGSRSLARLTVHRHTPSITYDLETCRQCLSPSCMTVCPTTPNSIYVDEKTGARVINQKTCIGCGLCASACPFNAKGATIKYNTAKKTYVKCDLCSGRSQGPACVEACQWGGITAKAS